MLEKSIRRISYVLTVVEVVLIFMAFFTNTKYVHYQTYDICKPSLEQKAADGSETFTFHVEEMGHKQETIAFFTNHQFVEVFEDGELVYSVLKDGGVWGHTTGSVWNFVPVRNGAKELVVKLTPAYNSTKFQDCTFYKGRELDIFLKLFRESLPAFLSSAMVVVLGIGMIIAWAVMKNQAKIGKSLLYLGNFSVILGLWSVNETTVVALFLNNRIGSYFMAYILLMMLEIPFVLFTKEFLRIGDRKIWKILCGVSVVENIVVFTLQFLGICEMKETLFLTHIVLCMGMLYMIGCLIYKVRRHRVDSRVRVSIIGITMIAIATFVDILTYYFRFGDADTFGRYMFLIFVLLLTWESASEAVAAIEKGKKAAEYQRLANIDALTGLYSRSSYERDIASMPLSQDAMIVTFDLNDLKACNDKYGHKAGDAYLVTASAIIDKIFQKYGKIYRIGGDEFCCIIKKADKCPIRYCIEQLIAEEEKIEKTKKNTGYRIRIACGYAVYDATKDKDLEATRDRSDVMMYQHKTALKRIG